ncbi:class A beta-lactamase-related serine hydrolase [Mariniphaga sediminis]|jgi:CubicO group peptidase (beta-lactamase class C family)|uniref:Class A beta-lactamase-related serine hydrolase n=1 Tax=Mariniphaga sediminis TaxID=1628158 RepID=A0A399D396_9BACT|nr:serine hydrolase domain-containing protein [Mariniphaga sediminis]RIH64870.1 class A beta-lactamase-related serine hydrolase [Mariniphaga sediminis]
MKQIFFCLIFSTLLLVLGGCEKKQANVIYDKSYIEEIKQTRKDIALHITRNYIPGATISIAKDNRVIYSEGIGLASKELDVPMTRENKLRIGDVSQIFTNIIYLKLVEEGILNPDSTVQHYIPEYPPTEFKLAIKHLPYHTSGIRKEEPGETEIPGLNITIQNGLKDFMNDPLTNPPGWFQESSMFNSNLLGAVMEKATNKNFLTLLKEYVTQPLNLTHTLIDNPSAIISGRADFYNNNLMGQNINAPFRDLRYKAPSKGILSNTEDLVKLGMAILESEYFNEEFRENFFEPCDLYGGFKSEMANGWLIMQDKKGREFYGSGGGVTGGGAAILIYPDESLVVAYAVNHTLETDMPVFKIAHHFLQDLGSDEK